jgi:hypothetical protein
MSEVEATGLKTKEVPHNDDKTNGEHATLHYPHSNNNNNTNSTMTTTTTRKQRLEAMSTIGMKGQRTIDAFYDVMWPILEKEGGWTLVRIMPKYTNNIIIVHIINHIAIKYIYIYIWLGKRKKKKRGRGGGDFPLSPRSHSLSVFEPLSKVPGVFLLKLLTNSLPLCFYSLSRSKQQQPQQLFPVSPPSTGKRNR